MVKINKISAIKRMVDQVDSMDIREMRLFIKDRLESELMSKSVGEIEDEFNKKFGVKIKVIE